VLACLALLLACGDADAPPEPAAPRDVESLKRVLGAPPRVTVEDGRVSIHAKEARRLSLLRELAEQARFDVEVSELPAGLLTLDLSGATVEAALAELLSGADFRVLYRFDVERQAHVIARVDVGAAALAAPAQVAAAQPPAPAASDGRWSRRHARSDEDGRVHLWHRREQIDPEERERRREERRVKAEAALEQLASPASDARAAALGDVDMNGPARDQVFVLAAEDPDPAVRVAALDRLSEEDSGAALEAIHRALADPAPEVVRAAIGALDIVGDETSLPYLHTLAEQHPDPDVRKLARETEDFLR
jgi:hypothetical protein